MAESAMSDDQLNQERTRRPGQPVPGSRRAVVLGAPAALRDDLIVGATLVVLTLAGAWAGGRTGRR
jgi:hypothetical protein